MKLIVNTKINHFMRLVIFLLIFSITVFGQIICPRGIRKQELCNNVEYCSSSFCICDSSKNPANNCTSSAQLFQYTDNDAQLAGALLTVAKGEELTAENVAKNQELLANNNNLREGLERGELTIEGKTVMFTPFGRAKEFILEQRNIERNINENSPIENRIRQRTESDGFDDAVKEYREYLKEYRKYLGTPNSTPVGSDFFLNLGREYMQKNTLAGTQTAIEIFKFDSEQNNSQASQTELDVARQKSVELLIQQNNIPEAKKTLRIIRNDEKTNPQIKIEATQKLRELERVQDQ